MSDKLDPNSYLRHPKIIVLNNDYQKIEGLLTSNLLLIKWHWLNGQKSVNRQKQFIGGIRQRHPLTDLGEFPPVDSVLTIYDKPLVQFLQFAAIGNLPYFLEVRNPAGVTKSQIEIWEYEGTDQTYFPLGNSSSSGNTNIMTINYPPTSTPNSSSGVSTTVTYSASSTTIVAANALRVDGGLIINNANRNLWINFSATAATTASPSIMVPANGGSVDIPNGYVGAVTGIWLAGGTGNATVVEFI